MREKRQIEAKLTAAGGQDFNFLLEDCADLSDLIEEMREVNQKRSQKEHAAFDTKVKFSRKIRRKAKDLNKFEQGLTPQYEKKQITFEHGKKMATIIKQLRFGHVEDAEALAGEFYALLEMGERLEMIEDSLSKKRAQVERAKRGVLEQLAEVESLQSELALDLEKIGRHDEKARLGGRLAQEWSDHLQSLKSGPLIELLGKMREASFGGLAFPQISAADAESMAAFLKKTGLESKSAAQLYEMAGESDQKLRHYEMDLAGFRQEVVARRAFLFGITSYQPAGLPEITTDSPALAGLSPQAHEMAARLVELGKTAEADEKEWERAEKMKEKKAKELKEMLMNGV